MGFVLSAATHSKFMKTNRVKSPTRLKPKTRFDVVPVAPVPFRGTRETELEQFKNRLLRSALREAMVAELYAPLRRAASEAAAVAWMTPFPLLFLPVLFEEKIAGARRQFERARSVRTRSRKILAEVL